MTEPDLPEPGSVDATAPGFEAVSVFSSTREEYAAIRGAAALVDRSGRLRMVMSGASAASALTGLVTNDVLALHPGSGLYAAALTAKGKVIADVRIFSRAADLLVDVPRPAADGFSAMIRKYVNPRLAKYSDVSETMRCIGVFGPRAKDVLSDSLDLDASALAALGPYHHMPLDADTTGGLVAAAPDFGTSGFDVMIAAHSTKDLWDRLVDAGAVPTGTDACEIARVEAGRPLWGVDMDDATLAQEANFDALSGISYTKGCYTGQETVARVHFRGHVNRSLRGLRSTRHIPRGAQLFDPDSLPVGDVRSSVESPRLGAIAIAMLKRTATTETEVIARWEAGECRALVVDLPFE